MRRGRPRQLRCAHLDHGRAKRIRHPARAIRDKAGELIVQNGDNNWVRGQLHQESIAEERRLCCLAQNTCD